MSATFQVPQISKEEMDSFHQAHYSVEAMDRFASQFLQPPVSGDAAVGAQSAQEDLELEEDDGLGFYEDGTKRTLTDEQIAIFRHSELETLRRQQARSKPANEAGAGVASESMPGDQSQSSLLLPPPPEQDDGEVADSAPEKKKKRKSKHRQSSRPEPSERVDLRKRTWDKVDAGLDTLDYD